MGCGIIDPTLVNLVPNCYAPPLRVWPIPIYWSKSVTLCNFVDTALHCPFIMFCGLKAAKFHDIGQS